jgi:hypothetical protein
MDDLPSPTVTTLLAGASELLENAGYERVAPERSGEWPTSGVRVHEDAYSIVAVTVFDTWEELAGSWTDAQVSLVELISKYISREEPKAWEGYLVLLTPSLMNEDARRIARAIRSDATFVRKLVGSGDELRSPDGLAQVMRSLLPIAVGPLDSKAESALDLLPALLEQRHCPPGAVRILVDAFVERRALVESLHTHVVESED